MRITIGRVLSAARCRGRRSAGGLVGDAAADSGRDGDGDQGQIRRHRRRGRQDARPRALCGGGAARRPV